MKLIGSKVESDIRKQLVESHQDLFFSDKKKRIRDTIFHLKPALRSAYIIKWIPEQGEDIVHILTDDHTILKLELSHIDDGQHPIWNAESLLDYKKGLRGKSSNIRLTIALELLAKDLAN